MISSEGSISIYLRSSSTPLKGKGRIRTPHQGAVGSIGLCVSPKASPLGLTSPCHPSPGSFRWCCPIGWHSVSPWHHSPGAYSSHTIHQPPCPYIHLIRKPGKGFPSSEQRLGNLRWKSSDSPSLYHWSLSKRLSRLKSPSTE